MQRLHSHCNVGNRSGRERQELDTGLLASKVGSCPGETDVVAEGEVDGFSH